MPPSLKILKDGGVDGGTAEKLHDLVQRCENAVYSGRGAEVVRPDVDLGKLIKKIEKECR